MSLIPVIFILKSVVSTYDKTVVSCSGTAELTARCSVFYSLPDSHTAIRQEVTQLIGPFILAEIFE